MKGEKWDKEKLRWSLFPFNVLQEILKVLEYGAKKYSLNNWIHVQNPRQRYFDACMRHLTAWWDEEVRDPETGINHLAHACCCILFLLWFDLKNHITDEKSS